MCLGVFLPFESSSLEMLRSNHPSVLETKREQVLEEYPKVKVKVRQEEDADQFALELSSLQSLKAFESLSPYDSFSDDSPTSIVRIPGSFVASPVRSDDPAIRDGSPTSIVRVPDSSTSTSASFEDPVSKGTSTKKEIGSDGNKTNIRANMVLRPRAVLSSPDNDTMIGSTNKTRKQPLPTERNHKLCQNRHNQCKVMPRPVQKGSNKPRASMITGHGRNDQNTGGPLGTKDSSKISSHLKGKTEPLPRKTSIKPTNDK
ncbi:hypothetical protein LIER_29488 [Lithospermum erythrorhizon]|uniref:Uncharacterized protein n=1 Tax=Lithospermum erythrorhizon TaxID=34254 RepID=A0AAV3RMQ1_LITER